MEELTPWMVGRIGKKCWLLAKDEQAYYLIEVGKNLDWETEEWLMRQGISEVLLKELNLAFTYMPKKDIRGVAFSGSEAGDCVYLYLRSEKRKLTLELDYDREWMEDFFRDIPRFQVPAQLPTKTEQKKDWRAGKQNPALFQKLRFVPPACLTLGLTGSIGFSMTRHWAFFTLCMVLLAVQFGLMIVMPAYFTFEIPKEQKKKRVWELWMPITTMYIILFLNLRFNWLDDNLYWIGAVFGIGVAFVIYLLVPDFQRQKWSLLGVLIFGFMGGCFVIGTANEVYDFSEPASYVLEVENTDKSSGRSTSYYCTVTLPDGREVELDISRRLYDDLEAGDCVRVEIGQGALGFEYANAYRYEEGE